MSGFEWVDLGDELSVRYNGTYPRKGAFACGFDVTADGLEPRYVSAPSVPLLIAWLRKTYPEHFAESADTGGADTPAGVLSRVRDILRTPEGAQITRHAEDIMRRLASLSVDTRTAVGVVPDVNAANEFADAMERAAAAAQRIRGER